MIDAKLVEEIVQQVLSRLMEDPRFVAAAKGGYFSGSPVPSSNQSAGNGLQFNSGSSINSQTPWFNRPSQGQQVATPSTRNHSSVNRHHGRVLSEWDILTVHRSGGRAIAVARSVIVTPLAKDRARDLSVEIIVER